MSKLIIRVWVSRSIIAIVFGMNILCALFFILTPERYTSAFELSVGTGGVIVRGMGILFLMWNVPYFVAMLHPLKHRLSLIEACVMQFFGAGGEIILLLGMINTQSRQRITLERFAIFDGLGLLLLLVSLLLVTVKPKAIKLGKS